ncbi:flagellar type III secretion system pore protein FliP [Afifella sp. H1R]|uniref:flagellar type III secretion system pore protein FliP n=1 Tax=Afifella sp. H1R TaxID=2908841 RepID=UPI001EEBBC75|nr:flagellar type III secretion system pore protein FliP [Afifella sp. H1R]MCF1503820.1 flagellar type III secretion system pore protein FliP [Afifella sp. H1R]
MKRLFFALLLVPFLGVAAHAQVPDLESLIPSGDAAATGRIVQLVAILTVLSIAPGLLIMVTSFTRFIIALSFLRSGLGLQGTPGNLVLISLSLFMTFYVMGPTLDRAWTEGLQPLTNNEITEQEAFERITDPFHDFMLTQVRPKDLQLFADLSASKPGAEEGTGPALPETGAQATQAESVPLRVLIPAFMISELRRGFEIGFLIVLPFLVIDMIVATLVMSMGMMMMPPAVIALPFKILFFVLIDGWNLLVGGLVRSFF